MFAATQPLERKELAARKEEQRYILTWGANPARQCLSEADEHVKNMVFSWVFEPF